MARPLIMLSVVLVYVAGTVIAWSKGVAFDGVSFTWGLAAVLVALLSIHYTNEFADFETDALTQRTPFSGGSGVLPSGRVSRQVAWIAAWVMLILSLLVAGVAWITDIFPFISVVVLVLGLFGGWMYSLPPLKLAWRGWGEIDNAILGGLLLPMFGYSVQSGQIDWLIVSACLPFTILVFVNLLATTWPDRHADTQVGKYTLATRLPTQTLRWIYVIAVSLSLVLLLLIPRSLLPEVVVLMGLPALPFLIWGGVTYTRRESPFPMVAAMMTLLVGHMAGWLIIGM